MAVTASLFVRNQYCQFTEEGGEIYITPVEYEVLIRFAKGLRNSQIAEELEKKTTTINSYLEVIKKKLGVSSTSEITAFFRSNSERIKIRNNSGNPLGENVLNRIYQLSDQNLSTKVIAQRVGVGSNTVRRYLLARNDVKI